MKKEVGRERVEGSSVHLTFASEKENKSRRISNNQG